MASLTDPRLTPKREASFISTSLVPGAKLPAKIAFRRVSATCALRVLLRISSNSGSLSVIVGQLDPRAAASLRPQDVESVTELSTAVYLKMPFRQILRIGDIAFGLSARAQHRVHS